MECLTFIRFFCALFFMRMMIYVTQTHNDYIKLHNCFSVRVLFFCVFIAIQILFYHRNIFAFYFNASLATF